MYGSTQSSILHPTANTSRPQYCVLSTAVLVTIQINSSENQKDEKAVTLYGTNVIISISTLVVELQFSYRTVVMKEGGQYFVGVAICIVDRI